MLDIISDPAFLAHVEKVGNQFGNGLMKMKEEFSDKIIDVRGRGLMWGIEFIDEFTSLYFVLSSVKNGVFCDYCGNNKATSKFLPPLIVSENQIDEILERITTALKNL